MEWMNLKEFSNPFCTVGLFYEANRMAETEVKRNEVRQEKLVSIYFVIVAFHQVLLDLNWMFNVNIGLDLLVVQTFDFRVKFGDLVLRQ